MAAKWRVVDVPLRLSPSARRADTMSRPSQLHSVAVCEAVGVVAVANGRTVDLYDVVACGWTRPHGADSADAEPQLHLPLVAQISLAQYLQTLSACSQDAASDVRATCVSFPAAGMLLVGGVATDDEHGAADAFLLGFRLYTSSATRFSTLAEGHSDSKPAKLPRVTVHFSFAEPIKTPGFPVMLIVCRHVTTAQAGAVLITMHASSEIVVFSWAERFSSRQVSAASVAGRTSPLVSAAVSPDGRFAAVASEEGFFFLLDWSRFSTLIDSEIAIITLPHTTTEQRLLLGVCSRAGRVVEDNPLDCVRLVATARGEHCGILVMRLQGQCSHDAAIELRSADGTDEFDRVMSLQWWRWSEGDDKRDYILVGKQDGSLSVRPLRISRIWRAWVR